MVRPDPRSPENKTFPATDGKPFHHYVAPARNPWFFDRWLKMNGTTVMRSRLTDREKLMVIMHTAWWTRCSYTWLQRDKNSDEREAHISSQHWGGMRHHVTGVPDV